MQRHHAAVFVYRESRIIAGMNERSSSGMSESPEGDFVQNGGSRWRWPLRIVAIAVILVLASRYLRNRESAMWRNHPAVGSTLTAVRLEPLTGAATGGESEFTNDQMPGKVTLINFWGPWCHFCVEEFPHLQKLEEKLRNRSDFQFVSVSSAGNNDDQAEEVKQLAEETREFLQERNASFPTYVDRKAALRIQYLRKSLEGGFGFPTTLVLDKTGTIRGVWPGYRPGDELQIASLVEELLTP